MKPPSSRQRLAPFVVLAAIAALLAGCTFGKAAKTPAAGDCYASDAAGSQLAPVDCTSSDANLVVLEVTSGSDTSACKTVAGANSAAVVGDSVLCLGEVGKDPDRDARVADVGDCLSNDGSTFERTDCDSSDATYDVLKRLTDVSKDDSGTACDGVTGTTSAYSWSWDADGTTVDVVLCLEQHIPGPAPSSPALPQ